MFTKALLHLVQMTLLATLAATPSPKLEGSGEALSTKAGRTNQSWKFFWSGPKGRLETDRTILLVDLEKEKALMLNPEKSVYAELPPGSAKHVELYENPCKDDKELKQTPHMICKKLGKQQVNGRETIKWTASHSQFPDQPLLTYYLDQKFGFVVRKERDDIVEEIKNFKEGSQAASLFNVPEKFSKVSREDLARSYQ